MTWFVTLSLAAGFAWTARADAPGQPADPVSVSEVGQWIEKLGDASYATRVRARDHLQRMGLQAFDELYAAQFHADSEIAMASRHLVSSLLVSWSTETDPEAVRDALDEYGAQTETERQNRMDRLAELPNRQGLAALCRLARFETSLRLSGEAALAVMRHPIAEDPETRLREAEIIRAVIGPNDRRAADWLRAYADDLAAGTYSIPTWRDLVQQQRQAIDDGSDSNVNRPAVLELVQVCAARAVAAGMREEAIQLSIKHLDLIPPRARDVIDACSWAIDNQMHSIVLELQKRHAELFDRQPILLYGAAEALLAQNDPDGAERLADQALVVDPLPPVDSAESEKLSPKVIEDIAHRHREVGLELESRGLFRWAEREYRHIIDSSAIDSTIAAVARSQLASMLAELDRHRECAEVLGPIVERAEADQQYSRRLISSRLSVSRLKSMRLFQQGLTQVQSGELELARKSLSSALELDSENADILIAMFRTEGDESWRRQVSKAISLMALRFENQIDMLKVQNQSRLRLPDASLALAQTLNQYAWLISNTEGNYQKALEYSLFSLELNPDEPAQLDTAGRCYFAVGDLQNAIAIQRRAVKLMPHSPPLKRQLAMFEAAIKANEESKEGETPSEGQSKS
ncbi:MAG: tetratricopeptide repeat protein [Planctomycetaceae bacterium]